MLGKIVAQTPILKPLSYLLIEHENLYQFNFVIPSILTSTFALLFIVLEPYVIIFGSGGLVESINSSIGALIGFYIAALAAIATFENKRLDKIIVGRPATLTYFSAGKEYTEKLTRRRFLSFLFGYCSFTSIVLFVVGTFANAFYTGVKLLVPLQAHMPLTLIFACGYIFVFFNLIITTFLGLFYLSDRLHRD